MGSSGGEGRDITQEVRIPTGDGRVVIVIIRYAANTVIVVPVPPRPRGPDYTYMLRGADEDHSISVEITLERPGG